MTWKKIVKKSLICGLSLLAISSLSAGNVGAKHIRHHHARITKVARHHRYYGHKALSHDAENLKAAEFFGEFRKEFAHIATSHGMKGMSRARAKLNRLYAKGARYLTPDEAYDLYHDYGDMPLNHHNTSSFRKLAEREAKKVEQEQAQQSAEAERVYTDNSRVGQLSQQDSDFDTQVRADLIQDINKSRVANGENPLTVTNISQSTADYRAPKVQYAYDHLQDYLDYPHNTPNPTSNWIHGMDTHTTGGDYLSTHCPNVHGYWSANAGDWSDDANAYGDDTSFVYPDDTPEHVAYNINNGLMNHDECQGNHNGHRFVELYHAWKYVGVGTTYNPNTHIHTYNEQYLS